MSYDWTGAPDLDMLVVMKFQTLVASETAQTQTWLLLKKQSDKGLPCLLFEQAFCEFQPWLTKI